MNKIRRIALVVAITLFPQFGITTPAIAAPVDDEAAFVNDINSLRASKGLHALVVNNDLRNMARAWAQQMANNGAISHNPNLSSQGPSGWLKLGENVGVGGNEPQLHEAFVNSPGHYKNLVDGDFRYIGVGVVYQGGRLWVVEQFMKSSVNPSPSSVASAAAAAAPIVLSKQAKYRAVQGKSRFAPRSSTQKQLLDRYASKG